MLELTNHTKYLDLTSHTIKMSSKDETRLLMSNLGLINLFKSSPDVTVFESDKNGKELSTTLNLLDTSLCKFYDNGLIASEGKHKDRCFVRKTGTGPST